MATSSMFSFCKSNMTTSNRKAWGLHSDVMTALKLLISAFDDGSGKSLSGWSRVSSAFVVLQTLN